MRLAVVAGLALGAGCFHAPPPRVEPPPSSVRGAAGRLTVELGPVIDARPAAEQRPSFAGVAEAHRYLFSRYEVVRGNDGDPWLPASSPELVRRVHEAVAGAITGAGAVSGVVVGDDRADLVLSVRVLHLFASQHVAGERSAIEEQRERRRALADERGVSGSGEIQPAAPGETAATTTFGNVTLELTLLGRRGELADRPVWRRVVTGSVATTRDTDFGSLAAAALREAAQRGAVALARDASGLREALGGTGGDQPAAQRNPSFVVHRVSLGRDALELLFVDPATGSVVGRRIEPNTFGLQGQPGEYLLAPLAPDGRLLGPAEYERLAASLAARFDLRRVDDARLYHYFGRRRP